MTWDRWFTLYGVLCRRMDRPVSGEQAKDFFAVLTDVSDEGAERAVDQWTRENSRMPKAAELLALVRSHHKANPARDPVCQSCHGDKWVPALPFKAHGQIVECVKRCPDCGSPAPQHYSHVEQVPLTATEYQRYLADKSEPREPGPLAPQIAKLREVIMAKVRA